MSNGLSNLLAHLSFTTTVAPAQPTVTRNWRCAIVRDGVLTGQYTVTLTEAIANVDLQCIASVADGTTWCDVKVAPTANASVWSVITYGGGVGADIGLLNLAGALVRLDFVKVNPA